MSRIKYILLIISTVYSYPGQFCLAPPKVLKGFQHNVVFAILGLPNCVKAQVIMLLKKMKFRCELIDLQARGLAARARVYSQYLKNICFDHAASFQHRTRIKYTFGAGCIPSHWERAKDYSEKRQCSPDIILTELRQKRTLRLPEEPSELCEFQIRK
jgi:hypothetical protein